MPRDTMTRLSSRRLAVQAAALALLGLSVWSAGRYLWAWYHFRTAEEALAARKFSQALAHLASCLKIWPNSAEAHLLAARAARRAGRREDAEQYRTALRRLGGSSDALTLEYALLRAEEGDVAGTESYLRGLLERGHPETVPILEALTQGYVQTYRLFEALDGAGQLLKLEPDHVQGLLWHGWALEQLDRHREALEDYRRAVALDPTEEYARLSLGEVLLFMSQPDLALEQFVYLQARLPDNPAVLLGLAQCRRSLGQVGEARQLLDGLVAAYPKEPGVLLERGRLALDEDQPALAERWLRQAVALSPADRQANYTLYLCLQRLGRAGEARTYLARFEEAEAASKRLSELSRELKHKPRAAAERFEIGRLYLRLGRDEEGERWLQSALRDDPAHVETHLALAELYERKGNAALAQRHRQLAARGSSR
jgi:tetratricopeptide (TPR) repeat protein